MANRIIFSIVLFLPLVFGQTAHIDRVLFIGNSITYLYPYGAWPGGWGVAASQPDRDYVHRVQLALTAQQGHIVEIAIERFDVGIDVLLEPARGKVATFAPDIIIVQVGDNAQMDEETYKLKLRQLLVDLCDCTVIVTGVWYDGAGGTIPQHRSQWNQQIAAEVGAAFAPISDLYNGQHCAVGDYICTHPDDSGMAAIADRILTALNWRSS